MDLEKLKQDIEAYKQSEQEATEIIAELKAENERLKSQIKDLQIHKDRYYLKGLEQERQMSDYITLLQEIKTIADARCNECKYGKDGISCEYGDCGEAKLHLITQLITKEESEG